MRGNIWELMLFVTLPIACFYFGLYRLLIKQMHQKERKSELKSFKEPEYKDLDKTLNILGIPKESDTDI